MVDLGLFRDEGGYFGEVKVDTYPGKLTVCLDVTSEKRREEFD